MKYIIDEETGSVYCRGVENPTEEDIKIGLQDEVFYAPLCTNNSFDTEEGTMVDCWESPETEYRIKTLLGITCKCPTCHK